MAHATRRSAAVIPDMHTLRTQFAAWVRASVASLALLACVGCALVGCGNPDAVVVYVSADETVARPVLERFAAATGIRVSPVFDTEATKTTGLAQRLRAEANRPRADVFWSSEIVQTIALADEDVLEPVASPSLDRWPAEHRDPSGRWFAFAARARVIVYAPSRVPEGSVPERWTDLARERFKGRVVMADPRFGTTRTHLGVLAVTMDRMLVPGAFEAFVEGLAETEARLLTSGNAGVVEAVAAGEADLGMTDADDVWAAKARGLDVELVYPRHAADPRMPGGGTLLIPNTVAVVRGTRRKDDALRLVEYLLSPECERTLAASVSRNIPLGPDVPIVSADVVTGQASLAPADPLRVDWRAASARTDAAVARAMEVLTAPRDAERSSRAGGDRDEPADRSDDGVGPS